MAESLRIALVAEGPTDRIVIEAALKAILGERTFVLTQLQPEGSIAFGSIEVSGLRNSRYSPPATSAP